MFGRILGGVVARLLRRAVKRALMGVAFKFRTRNFSPIIQWLNTPLPVLFRAVGPEYAEILLSAVKEEAPVRTGKLRESITVDWESSTTFLIKEGVPYGKFVRLGTRAHPIYPRYKRALYWPGLDHPIRYVKNHPGTRADPYHLRALRRTGLDRYAQSILDEFARRAP